MVIKCFACGASGSLDMFMDNEAATKALMLALDITNVGQPLVKYLGLFRPAKRQLSWSRVLVLLSELTPLIKAQRIERDRVVYDVPMAVWEVALDKVLAMRDSGKLALPLKTHGYLFEIIVTEVTKASHNGSVAVSDNQPPITNTKLSATAQALINLEARKRKGAGGDVVG